MNIFEGQEILEIKDNIYLADATKTAMRNLLNSEPHNKSDFYNGINALLDSTRGYEFIPSEDKLAHIIMQMEAPGKSFADTLAENLEGVIEAQPSEDDIRDRIFNTLQFGKVYFAEEGFLGITLGKYNLVLQIGEPSGKPGIFFLRAGYNQWRGYNPREPLNLDQNLNRQSFNGYVTVTPGDFGRQFTSYIDTQI